MFNELRKKEYNLYQSFTTAVQRTEQFTYSNNENEIFKFPYFDTAKQHPLIDDNGDGIGENILPLISDGANAKEVELGFSKTDDENPVEFDTIKIIPEHPELIESDTTEIVFTAKVNNNENTKKVWIEIRTPSPNTNTHTLKLPYNSDKGLYENAYNLNSGEIFNDSGKYSIFFYVKDVYDVVSGSDELFVYRGKENNRPPNTFHLETPADQQTTSTDLTFKWNHTNDPDGDKVTYTLILSNNSEKRGIEDNMYRTQSLKDGTQFSWKVRAIDEYGLFEDTNEWSFITDNPNHENRVFSRGRVFELKNNSKIPIYNAEFEYKSEKITSSRSGWFYLPLINTLQGETVSVTVKASGYEIRTVDLKAIDEKQNVYLTALQFKKGDINHDHIIDLSDIILCLKVLSDFNKDNTEIYNDVFLNNQYVDLKDAINILKTIHIDK